MFASILSLRSFFSTFGVPSYFVRFFNVLYAIVTNLLRCFFANFNLKRSKSFNDARCKNRKKKFWLNFCHLKQLLTNMRKIVSIWNYIYTFVSDGNSYFFLDHHGFYETIKLNNKQIYFLTFLTLLAVFDHALSSHLLCNWYFSHALRTTRVGAWYGNFKQNLVKCKFFKRYACRGTPVFGPSTNTWKQRREKSHYLLSPTNIFDYI